MQLRDHNCKGYRQVALYKNGKATTCTVHSLVAKAFIGPRPTGYVINHKDTNKANNRYENLEYITHQDNITHAKDNGLLNNPFGAEAANARLTELQAQAILNEKYTATGADELAQLYLCSMDNVRRIWSRKTWPDLIEPKKPKRLARKQTKGKFVSDEVKAQIKSLAWSDKQKVVAEAFGVSVSLVSGLWQGIKVGKRGKTRA